MAKSDKFPPKEKHTVLEAPGLGLSKAAKEADISTIYHWWTNIAITTNFKHHQPQKHHIQNNRKISKHRKNNLCPQSNQPIIEIQKQTPTPTSTKPKSLRSNQKATNFQYQVLYVYIRFTLQIKKNLNFMIPFWEKHMRV